MLNLNEGKYSPFGLFMSSKFSMWAKNVHPVHWDASCGDRLRFWITKKFSSYGDAATAIGVTASNLSKYMGAKKEPSVEVLLRFQRENLSLDWVTTGRGSMELPKESNQILLLMDGRAMLFDEAVDLLRADLSARPKHLAPPPTELPEKVTPVGYVGNLDGVLDYLARTTKEGGNQEEEGERKRDGDSVLL